MLVECAKLWTSLLWFWRPHLMMQGLSYSLVIEGMEKFLKAKNELLDDHEDDYQKQSLTYEHESLTCRQTLVTFLAF